MNLTITLLSMPLAALLATKASLSSGMESDAAKMETAIVMQTVVGLKCVCAAISCCGF